MEVVLAKSAGFCFGVKRAVETVYNEIDSNKNIYTYGPIVHNEMVVRDLENKGVKVIDSIDELNDIKEGTLIIRAHGIPKYIYDTIEKKGLKIVDATCPFVKKIHRIVEESSKKGEKVIVVGNAKHPEVVGIVGWCAPDNKAEVIETNEEADNFSLIENRKILIVSQTTFNFNKFQELVEIFEKKGYDINVVNTICNATEERQLEAREIASKVDAMIVIGGQNSSNTQKLYEICRHVCDNTQYIQTLDDLNFSRTDSISCIGITAGASTPNKIIEEVQKHVGEF